MNMPDFYKEDFIPCEITLQQVSAIEGFCNALRSYNDHQAAIPSQIAENALRALIELSQGEESDQSNQQWYAMRSPATQLAGISVVVKNQLGDELMLQLDSNGRPHIGTWTLFDEEKMPVTMLLFNLVQASTGWILRLSNEDETTEIMMGDAPNDLNWTNQPDYYIDVQNDDDNEDNLSEPMDEVQEKVEENTAPADSVAEGLTWTNQPDFGEEIEMDALAEDGYAEVTAAVEEETEGFAVLTEDPLNSDQNELTEKNNETIFNPDHSEEKTMPENTNRPPKPPPIRRVEPPRQQPPPDFRQPVTSVPSQSSKKLALISLIVGIVSIVGMLASLCVGCVGIFSFFAGIAAAVMGYLSKMQIDEGAGRDADRKMANYGMILGIVGAVLSIISILIRLLLFGFSLGLDWLLI